MLIRFIAEMEIYFHFLLFLHILPTFSLLIGIESCSWNQHWNFVEWISMDGVVYTYNTQRNSFVVCRSGHDNDSKSPNLISFNESTWMDFFRSSHSNNSIFATTCSLQMTKDEEKERKLLDSDILTFIWPAKRGGNTAKTSTQSKLPVASTMKQQASVCYHMIWFKCVEWRTKCSPGSIEFIQ